MGIAPTRCDHCSAILDASNHFCPSCGQPCTEAATRRCADAEARARQAAEIMADLDRRRPSMASLFIDQEAFADAKEQSARNERRREQRGASTRPPDEVSRALPAGQRSDWQTKLGAIYVTAIILALAIGYGQTGRDSSARGSTKQSIAESQREYAVKADGDFDGNSERDCGETALKSGVDAVDWEYCEGDTPSGQRQRRRACQRASKAATPSLHESRQLCLAVAGAAVR